MNTTIINAGNHRYMNEFMTKLPSGMLNKVATNTGATTLALEQAGKTVICVPFKSLIQSKLKYCKENAIEAIGIYTDKSTGKSSISELDDFTGDKILVTYDSFSKLVDRINPLEWDLVVDEAHKLVDSGHFRGTAIRGVLDNYEKFKSFCFLTATPPDDKYLYPKLRDLPKFEVKWNKLEPCIVKVMPLKTNLYETVATIALKHKTGELNGNAHIFINTVKGIVKVVRHLLKSGEVNKDNIRIVTADTERNLSLIKQLGKGFQIEPNTTEAKKINFYTSTCFEGSDIFDEDGISYVVTDGSLDYTKINILTTLPQILGRIRDSIYRNTITLIYTPHNRYECNSEEEFEKQVLENLQKYSKTVDVFKTADEVTRQLLLKGAENNLYLIVEDGELLLNETALYNEMFNYKTIHSTYYLVDDESEGVLIEKSTTHNSVSYNYIPVDSPKITGLNKVRIGKVPNFRDLCIDYIKHKEADDDSPALRKINTLYPCIEEAFNVIGPRKMAALKYRQKDIEYHLENAKILMKNAALIIKRLNLKRGQRITGDEFRRKLQDVYKSFGITFIPKGTDIRRFYEVRSFNSYTGNTPVVDYVILNPRYRQ